MGIWMLGPPPDNSSFAELEYDYYISTKKEDGEDAINFRKGMHDLRDAVNLVYLVDEKRGEKLSQFVYEELHSEIRDRSNLYPDEEKGGYLLMVSDVQKLYDLIGDADVEAANKFTDNDTGKIIPDYFVLPEKQLEVKGYGEIDEKTGRLSLKNEIFSTQTIKDFLKTAIDHNRELVID